MIIHIEYSDHTTYAIDNVERVRFKDYKLYLKMENGTTEVMEILDEKQGLVINQCFTNQRLLFNIYEFNIANDDVAFNKFIDEKMEEWRREKCQNV